MTLGPNALHTYNHLYVLIIGKKCEQKKSYETANRK